MDFAGLLWTISHSHDGISSLFHSGRLFPDAMKTSHALNLSSGGGLLCGCRWRGRLSARCSWLAGL